MELRKAVEINAKVHKSALTLHSQVEINPNGKVRITPLGGLGEIGGNMTIVETQNSAIIIDAGMSFPDDSLHGVDILVPDFSYLEVIKDKLRGLLLPTRTKITLAQCLICSKSINSLFMAHLCLWD